MKVAFVMLGVCFGFADQAIFADMAATVNIQVADVISRLEKSSHKLSDIENDELLMARFAQEAFDLKNVSVTAGETEVTPFSLMSGINRAIKTHPHWDAPISKAAKDMIVKNRSKFEKIFANDSYTWPWFLVQLGDKGAAKKILAKNFAQTFEVNMKLTESVNRFGHGPLENAESDMQALEPLSTPAELVELHKKMNQMKIHVSNLPQSAIMT